MTKQRARDGTRPGVESGRASYSRSLNLTGLDRVQIAVAVTRCQRW